MSFKDVLPEPRKIFLGFLINRIADIEDVIYRTNRASSSVQALKGLIDILDEHSKTTLQKQYDELRNFSIGNNGHPVTQDDVERIFRIVTTYLHRTYLQEVNVGIIPASTLPTNEKPPTSEPIGRRVDARLT